MELRAQASPDDNITWHNPYKRSGNGQKLFKGCGRSPSAQTRNLKSGSYTSKMSSYKMKFLI
jgi:hypothetical protein